MGFLRTFRGIPRLRNREFRFIYFLVIILISWFPLRFIHEIRRRLRWWWLLKTRLVWCWIRIVRWLLRGRRRWGWRCTETVFGIILFIIISIGISDRIILIFRLRWVPWIMVAPCIFLRWWRRRCLGLCIIGCFWYYWLFQLILAYILLPSLCNINQLLSKIFITLGSITYQRKLLNFSWKVIHKLFHIK